MTSINIYNDVGPFRGVPEEFRQRTAAHANKAAAVAVAAAIREAREAGEETYEHEAFFPGPEAVTALDKGFFDDSVSSRSSARFDLVLFTLGFSVVIASIAVIFNTLGSHQQNMISALVGTAALIVIFVFSWIGIGKPAIEALSELRRQGYLDDALPQAAANVAGSCWLPGPTAMQIVSTHGGGKTSVRTVFYDSIGKASMRSDEGVESTVLTARDGTFIAALSWPRGHQVRSAHGLAKLIMAKAENARAKG